MTQMALPRPVTHSTPWRRVLFGVFAASSLFVAAGGFLHTRWGRPLLVKVFGASCPMFAATPDSIERARHLGVVFDRGTRTTVDSTGRALSTFAGVAFAPCQVILQFAYGGWRVVAVQAAGPIG